MEIIGKLMVGIGLLVAGGFVVFLFFISLPFLWWLWFILIGGFLMVRANEKKTEKEMEEISKKAYEDDQEGAPLIDLTD